MQKKVLAILVGCPVTENIYERIGAEIISKYFDVMILDCLTWMSVGLNQLVYNEVSKAIIYRVDNESTLCEIFSETSPYFVVDAIGKGKFTRQIQMICKKHDALYITYYLVPFPLPIFKKIVWKFFLCAPKVACYKIIGYVTRKLCKNSPLPPDIALLAGSGSCSPWSVSAKTVIFTGTPDYFNLRLIQQKANISKQRGLNFSHGSYILFIDDCLSLSFDYIITAQKALVEKNKYFYLLNEYFSKLEAYFKIPIIIAAHPNGKQLSNYKELFGGRKVLFDATAELSITCCFAMTHFSSAVAYPVILRKPILFLSLKEIENQIQRFYIAHMAGLLDCTVVIIDELFDEKKLFKLNEKHVSEVSYKAYESNFIINSNVNVKYTNPFEPLLNHLLSLN